MIMTTTVISFTQWHTYRENDTVDWWLTQNKINKVIAAVTSLRKLLVAPTYRQLKYSLWDNSPSSTYDIVSCFSPPFTCIHLPLTTTLNVLSRTECTNVPYHLTVIDRLSSHVNHTIYVYRTDTDRPSHRMWMIWHCLTVPSCAQHERNKTNFNLNQCHRDQRGSIQFFSVRISQFI